MAVFDAPQRKKNMKMVSHGGYYGCDLCISKAESWCVPNSVNSTKRVWPPSTANGQRRIAEETSRIASLLDQGNFQEETYGIQGLLVLNVFSYLNFKVCFF